MRGTHRVSKYIESQFTRKIYWSNLIIMRISHSGIIEIRKRREDSDRICQFCSQVMFVVIVTWQTTAVIRRRVDVNNVDVKDVQGPQ
jgi:hypothetical protein